MKKKIVSIYLCMLLITPFIVMTASANEPPSTPIIEGETEGRAGVEQEYTFVSTDPDGDDIFYEIEWGCGETNSTDYHPSGETASFSHAYSEGTYTIRVRAIDINQSESNWGTLEITMPKIKVVNLFFLRFLDQYPNLFLLLQKILGL